MNILVVTPHDILRGMKDPGTGTDAIHNLLRYGAAEHRIVVLHTLMRKRGEIPRLANPAGLKRLLRPQVFTEDGVESRVVECPMLAHGRFLRLNCARILAEYRRLRRFEDFEPDLLVAHFPNMAAGWIGRIPAARRVAVLHTSDVNAAKRNPCLIDSFAREYDACFARSRPIYDYFAAAGLSNLRSELILSGAPRVGEVQRSGRFGKGGIRILFAGRLIPRKGADRLIEAVRELSDGRVTLEIAGDGPERDALEQLAAECGIAERTVFWGRLSRGEVLERMKRADIFCLPSREETFGLVYLEAMACGCVVIGTRGEGIDGVIRDGENGFLAEPDEPAELTAVLRRICREMTDGEIAAMREKARETAGSLTEESASARYFELITGL